VLVVELLAEPEREEVAVVEAVLLPSVLLPETVT